MADKQPTTIKEVAKLLSELSAKLDAMNEKVTSELGGMSQSMDYMNKNFEEFKTTVENSKKEIKELKAEQLQLKKENMELAKELEVMKRNVIEIKQYSRKNNIEIKGLPLAPNENLQTVITEIGNKIGIQIAPSDIDVIHRVPTKDKNKPNVIVRFTTHSTRNRILTAAKRLRLSTSDFGFEHASPIYVNEHLCPESKILLGKATERKKATNWKFLWVTQGKILMRKAVNSGVVQICTEADLHLIA